MARKSGGQCDACRGDIGLWQAIFTSECAHTFHLRCVSGSATCPICTARWSNTPATAPAPAPATPFSFASPPPSSTDLFGQSDAAAADSSSKTSLFGQPWPSTTQNSSFSFSGAQTASPSLSLSVGRSLFGQQAPATPDSAPPATQTLSCVVCHVAMFRGQATVTSECNHTFHLRCISGSVCPVCSARWRDDVSVASSPSPSLHPFSSPPQPPMLRWRYGVSVASSPSPSPHPFSSQPQPPMFQPFTPLPQSFGPRPESADMARPVFNDDEPVEPSPLDGWEVVQEATNNGVLQLKTHCEHSAVARDTARNTFAVLVHAKGPPVTAEASARASLDLVTVLDASGSMGGSKLALLKQAMRFVIDHLGPGDRLSIVSFSSEARRVIRLTRMSDDGKASAKAAVESLVADGGTNIGGGLRVASEVLDGRRHRNTVASVILLSDGHDNHTLRFYGPHGPSKSYNDLVPRSLRRSNGSQCPPVHTFGFGTDHDAAAMHTIAEVTGGTFSFIENQAVVQDSFAQCIGGLLSVTAQEVRVVMECLHPGVRVRTVKSGRYDSRIDAGGRAASVDVGELYADEERRFLLFLDVPVAAGDGAEDGSVTRLIKVSCTYKDAATGRSVDVSCEDAAVQRPVVVTDMEPCVEVARERFRVEAAEDIEAARAAADRGEHAKAAQILDRRQEASAAAGLAGDERCAELVAELRELSARVANRREYEQTGRACLLAGMNSHAQQRASTVQLFGSAAPAFGTQTTGSPYGASAGSPFSFSFLQPTCGARPGPPGASHPVSNSSSTSFRGTGAAPQAITPPMFGCQPQQAATSLFACVPQQAATNPFGGVPQLSPFGCSAFGTAAPAPKFGSRFTTPAMQSMVESSRKEREQHQSDSATNGGSVFGSK